MATEIIQGPNDHYQNVKNKLQSAISTFTNVEDAIKNTLTTLSKFTVGLGSILDCRILR